jgi:protein-tyrosine phosphatase
MDQVRYSAATPGEMIVFGAQRPGYPSKIVGSDRVKDWISLMQKSGMRRVCCLLPPKQLAYYQVDLIAEYRKVFGESNVCGAEIEDFHLCDHETLERRILPFLLESDQANTPVVVHCSGGSGRTGHVLAAWLVRHRGLSVHDALAAVAATGRNPWEAVECGYATEKELHSLLVSDHSKT